MIGADGSQSGPGRGRAQHPNLCPTAKESGCQSHGRHPGDDKAKHRCSE